MGNQCATCVGDKEEGEVTIKGNHSYGSAQQRGNSQNTVFKGQVNYDEEETQKIVRLQSHVRGHQTRKAMKSGKQFKDLLSNEEGLEYKDEVTFNDGCVYKGQVKDGQRHGYGI